MTYSQQQQSGPKPNRLALWMNTRKTEPIHPDYKGNVEITWDLLQEMTAAFNSGQYQQDYSGRPCLKLDIGIYQHQPEGMKPIFSGRLSTVAETAEAAARREQARAQAAGHAAPQPPAAAPQPPAQAPVPVAPAAAPAPMPATPMPGAIHGQPAPMPPQPLPQFAAQVPSGF